MHPSVIHLSKVLGCRASTHHECPITPERVNLNFIGRMLTNWSPARCISGLHRGWEMASGSRCNVNIDQCDLIKSAEKTLMKAKLLLESSWVVEADRMLASTWWNVCCLRGPPSPGSWTRWAPYGWRPEDRRMQSNNTLQAVFIQVSVPQDVFWRP